MDPNTRALMMGAAGAGGAEKTYVEDVFSTWLYTGNGSTQTITNGIDLSGKGGLVWIKRRDSATTGHFHQLYDTARGVSKSLFTNTTDSEFAFDPGTALSAFNSTGFNLVAGLQGQPNINAATYASWTFRKAPGFFDVVTYTGDDVAGRTVAHSLGSVPGFMIVKATSTTGTWYVYHRTEGATRYLRLNETSSSSTGAGVWSNTEPTSSVFTTGSVTNFSGVSYVAYLFAHDAQLFGDGGNQSVIKCGSYTGNGSSSGPTIDLGWEPQWLLIKSSSTAGEPWLVYDSMRTTTSTSSNKLAPNSAVAENDATIGTASQNTVEFQSTGFRLTSSNTGTNQNGGTYIYIAIRRGPMKTPTDATKVFSAVQNSNFTAGAVISGQSVVDLSWSKQKDNDNSMRAFDRLRGSTTSTNLTLSPNSTSAEQNEAYWALDQQNGVRITQSLGTFNYTNYLFSRAPGFFDVVAYTGTGSARTVSHNLGVAPELMIVKQRDGANHWIVYSAFTTATDYLILSGTNATFSNGGIWNSTAPTSSVFTVATSSAVNGSGSTYIAYLFATLTGISKVGIYTGTGTTLSIDCGFTNGARFVLIKRTDSTGGWYLWDTARGIVSGNDPYLLLNSTAAEVTNTDYIDPLSSGFQISSTAPAAINANGGSFIYLAIA